MNIEEAIKERHSVRSFSGKALSPQQVEEISTAIKGAFSPFGGNVTIELRRYDLKGVYKPSTYGIIRNACDFLLMAMADGEESALSAGFKMEQVVLKATEMGLGTCWIGATFKDSDFDKGGWNIGESLRIISPIGEAAEKKSFLERIMRYTFNNKNRKPFNELFFVDSFHASLSEDNPFTYALQMLRLAPSSTNSQPWRALVDGENVHFYYKPKGEWSIVDCGIALYHFYATLQSGGHQGVFYKEEAPVVAPNNWNYLISYCLS